MQNRAALALAALVPFVAASTITVTSSCPFPVYLWNVVESVGDGNPTQTLSAGQSWSGSFTSRADQAGGPCIKLKKISDIWVAGNVAQVEYKMDPNLNTLFYDLSLINGDPFADQDVTMSIPSRSDCPVISCPASTAQCPDAYYHPDDPQTKGCSNGGGDIQVHLCGGSSGSSSGGSSSQQQPSTTKQATTLQPQAKPAPSPANNGANFLEEDNGGKVIVTQVTTIGVTSTVYATGPGPTDVKREAHLHQHARHGHSRVMGRHAH